APVKLAEEVTKDGFPVEVGDIRASEGVKRPDVGRSGGPQDGEREGRYQRLMQVNDVEVRRRHDLANLFAEPRADSDAGDGAVRGNADGMAETVERSGRLDEWLARA